MGRSDVDAACVPALVRDLAPLLREGREGNHTALNGLFWVLKAYVTLGVLGAIGYVAWIQLGG
jgi:hypothetical protein